MGIEGSWEHRQTGCNIPSFGGIDGVSLFCDLERAGGVILVAVICGDGSLGEAASAGRPAGVMLRSRLGLFKVEGTGIGVLDCFTDDTPCCEA